jgi:hypothetical protein
MASYRARRWLRWPTAVLAGLLAAAVCLWAFRFLHWPWLPTSEADRWVVAAMFATVAGTGVLTAVAWWAGREGPSGKDGEPTTWVSQRAKASGQAHITQVGRDMYPPGDGRDA